MQLRQLAKKIADGKVFLPFAIIFAVLTRIIYYLLPNGYTLIITDQGFLWNAIEPFFTNQLISIIAAAAFVASIVLLLSCCNTKFIVIREKTSLPPAFALFFFSCHPIFFTFSPYLIAATAFLGAVYLLFCYYQAANSAVAATNITILLLFGSLFIPSLLFFYVLILVGFISMRIINIKTILASLFTIIIFYAPFVTYFYLTNNIDTLLAPFTNLLNLGEIPLLAFTIKNWIILIFYFLILITACIHYYLNTYKEKIKIRIFLNLLIAYTILALFSGVLLSSIHLTGIYIAICIGCLLLSHYFALTKTKTSSFLFFLLITIGFIICYDTIL